MPHSHYTCLRQTNNVFQPFTPRKLPAKSALISYSLFNRGTLVSNCKWAPNSHIYKFYTPYPNAEGDIKYSWLWCLKYAASVPLGCPLIPYLCSGMTIRAALGKVSLQLELHLHIDWHVLCVWHVAINDDMFIGICLVFPFALPAPQNSWDSAPGHIGVPVVMAFYLVWPSQICVADTLGRGGQVSYILNSFLILSYLCNILYIHHQDCASYRLL